MASQAASHNSYRMGIYTFNYNGVTAISALTSNLSNAKTLAGNIDVMVVYKNNWLTSTNNNNDTDTDFEKAMSAINTIMPTPEPVTLVVHRKRFCSWFPTALTTKILEGYPPVRWAPTGQPFHGPV